MKVTQLSERIADYRITQWTLGKIQSIRQKKGETLHSFQKRRRTDLGFGIAEGFVLYKFSLPIWASAYLCVSLFTFCFYLLHYFLHVFLEISRKNTNLNVFHWLKTPKNNVFPHGRDV